FQFAAALIARGAQFRDILQFIYINDPRAWDRVKVEGAPEETQRRIAERLAGFGADLAFDYSNDEDRIIQVQESVTPSGGIYRLARNVTVERRREEAIALALRQRTTVTQVPTWFRRDVNGNLT